MRRKAYSKMNTAELAAATAKYDEPFGGWDEFKPMTSAGRRLQQKARRRGRPKVGRGAKRVMITVEKGLLNAADAYAKAIGMSRSELVSNGINASQGGVMARFAVAAGANRGYLKTSDVRDCELGIVRSAG